MLEILYWLLVAALGYVVVGYYWHMLLLARIRSRPWRKAAPPVLPRVDVILVARNEAARIPERIKNLLEQEYPKDLLKLIIVSDGSTDDTARLARLACGSRGRVIEIPTARGKPAGLNAGAAEADGDVLVFADARQSFHPDAISKLIMNFSDPDVGAVSGYLEIAQPEGDAAGKGVGSYWEMERSLREMEAQVDSCVGCTGAIYAIRRPLYEALPDLTILDDLVIPMRVAMQGKRVVFDREAIAYDPQPTDASREGLRKRRTLAGNFQCLATYPEWLHPARSRLWWKLLVHKYLRLAMPFFLAAIFLVNLSLMDRFPYDVLLAVQICFYGLAALGMGSRAERPRLIRFPAGFVFLNWMIIEGLKYYLSGDWHRGWAAPAPVTAHAEGPKDL